MMLKSPLHPFSCIKYKMLSLKRTLKKYTMLIASILLLSTYILPIAVFPWISFYHEYLVFVILLLIVLVIILESREWYVSYMVGVLLLVVLIPIIQFFTGIIAFWGDGLLVSCYLLGFVIAISCGQNVVLLKQRDAVLMNFATVFFVLSFINVCFALHQFFNTGFFSNFLSSLPNGSQRAYGNLFQPNNFSSVLIISFLSGWYLFEKQFFSRKVYYCWVFLIAIGLVLAQSRTVFVVGILLVFFYSSRCKYIHFKKTYTDLAWVFLSYCVCFLILSYIKQSLSVMEDSGIREVVVYDKARLSIWYESIKAVVDGPVWGYGWNQISVAQILLDSPLDSVTYFRHSHNLFLDLLLYNGPILGLMLSLCIVFLAWQAFIACKTVEGWVILAIVGALFSHAMLELPLHYSYFLFPLAFLVGLMDTKRKGKLTVNKGLCTYPSILNIPIAIAAIVLLVVMFNDYKIIQKEHYNLEVELNGFFERDEINEKTDDIVLLTQYQEHLNFGRAKAVEGMSDEDIEWMKKVSHRFASPYYLSKYAKACHLNNRHEEAERVLGVVKRLFGEDMYHVANREVYGELFTN
ncbi:hypothetical protein IMCC1989_1272 [gamma proteobacterium IMCC1989]|nr:hypothetical protein IMCC1989_1272 [gamma proteobacterium IMCC1989]